MIADSWRSAERTSGDNGLATIVNAGAAGHASKPRMSSRAMRRLNGSEGETIGEAKANANVGVGRSGRGGTASAASRNGGGPSAARSAGATMTSQCPTCRREFLDGVESPGTSHGSRRPLQFDLRRAGGRRNSSLAKSLRTSLAVRAGVTSMRRKNDVGAATRVETAEHDLQTRLPPGAARSLHEDSVEGNGEAGTERGRTPAMASAFMSGEIFCANARVAGRSASACDGGSDHNRRRMRTQSCARSTLRETPNKAKRQARPEAKANVDVGVGSCGRGDRRSRHRGRRWRWPRCDCVRRRSQRIAASTMRAARA